MGSTKLVAKLAIAVLSMYILNLIVGGKVQDAKNSIEVVNAFVAGISSLGSDPWQYILFFGMIGFILYSAKS